MDFSCVRHEMPQPALCDGLGHFPHLSVQKSRRLVYDSQGKQGEFCKDTIGMKRAGIVIMIGCLVAASQGGVLCVDPAGHAEFEFACPETFARPCQAVAAADCDSCRYDASGGCYDVAIGSNAVVQRLRQLNQHVLAVGIVPVLPLTPNVTHARGHTQILPDALSSVDSPILRI
jgi:hypothetical protein